MDGGLIDSEPYWQEAAIKAFAKAGVPNGGSQKKVEYDILDELDKIIAARGERMAGADYILAFFKSRVFGSRWLPLHTSGFIEAVLSKLDLHGEFEVIHSGELETYGKPHPAIYISTLKKLSLNHDQAIALEDSFNGLLAAKAARLKTVVIPENSVRSQTKYDIADLKLRSLSEFSEGHFKILCNSNPGV